jgi:RecA-family ATPase
MAIDLLNLQPQKISKDLKGKTVLLYGNAKVGKTTLAS